MAKALWNDLRIMWICSMLQHTPHNASVLSAHTVPLKLVDIMHSRVQPKLPHLTAAE